MNIENKKRSFFDRDLKTAIGIKAGELLGKIGLLKSTDPVVKPSDLELLGNGQRSGVPNGSKTASREVDKGDLI